MLLSWRWRRPWAAMMILLLAAAAAMGQAAGGAAGPATKAAPAAPAGTAATAAKVTALAGPRNRQWLTQLVNRPIQDTPRNRRYMALVHKSVAEGNFLGLNLEWFKTGRGDAGGGRDPGSNSRRQTNSIGRLAFCYRTSGTDYYQSPQVLDTLRQAYQAVVQHVTPDGQIKWADDGAISFAPHEQSWRLEPLLLGYIWVGEKFPPEERKVIEAALQRAAERLFKGPDTSANNRGMVWCAVTTLCGLYFERKDYLALAEPNGVKVINALLKADGECSEGAGGDGPDSNYSYTTWSYVYLYRLLSGRGDLDPKLLAAVRWFALYNTLSGCPSVAGASVRRRFVNPGNFQDILPAFERYSHADPFLATVAEHALTKREKISPGFADTADPWVGGGHCVSPLIWAMMENGLPTPQPAASAPGGTVLAKAPDWYVNHTAIYERPEVHYALIGRQYQTGVVFRGRTAGGYYYPLRGLQTFAFGDEYPILLHTDSTNSTTTADGIDTAAANVEKGPKGWEFVLAKGPKDIKWRAEPATITERHKTLWTIYAFTPVSAVAVYGGAKGPITSRWVMNRVFVSAPTLDAQARSVRFESRQGRMYYLDGQATLSGQQAREDAGDTGIRIPSEVLEVVANPPVSAFGFSDESFRFSRYDPASQMITFSDASGSYRLSLRAVLGPDGNLNRAAPMRLMKVGM